MRAIGVFIRGAGGFLGLPIVFALLLPWVLHSRVAHVQPLGVGFWIVGVLLLLWCLRDFCVAGRNPPEPWTPPTNQMDVGLHRVSRNPTYIAMLVILCGWAIAFASPLLWVYAAAMAVGFHLRITRREEPAFAEAFGDAWTSYAQRVPRWVGRVRGA